MSPSPAPTSLTSTDCEGRDLGVTNRDYVFNVERDGDQLDELLDSLDETWGES